MEYCKDSLMYSFHNVTDIFKTICSPMITYRPDEVFWDVIYLFSLNSSHTERCVNYIKRVIRHSVLFNEKSKGTIAFKIDPTNAWIFSASKVNKEEVTKEINKWLKDISDNNYPKRIIWIRVPSLCKQQQQQRCDEFIIHYWNSESSLE